MAAGRPTSYDKDVVPAVRDYIRSRKDEGRIPTVEGLAVFLDVDRSTIYEWAKSHPEFSDILDGFIAIRLKCLGDSNTLYHTPVTVNV
jgi:hypothetical protein